MYFHPLHDCNAGAKAPDIVNALIEIPARSKVKYTCRSEIQPGMLFVENILYSSTVYPHDYGFIPRTLCEDGNALCKPIGALRMVDSGVSDVKIIGVCPNDPMFQHLNDVSELAEHRFKEIRAFFEDYKKNHQPEPEEDIETLPPERGCFSPRVKLSMRVRDRSVWVDDELVGADEAKRMISEAMNMYLDKHPAQSAPSPQGVC